MPIVVVVVITAVATRLTIFGQVAMLGLELEQQLALCVKTLVRPVKQLIAPAPKVVLTMRQHVAAITGIIVIDDYLDPAVKLG